MAKKKHKNRQTPRHPQPAPAFRIPMANPGAIDVQKIKEDATKEAVRILEEKLTKSEAEMKRLQIEAYNEALDDAMKYILTMACRALKNKFRFGHIRMDRFITETMRCIEQEDIEEMVKWLAEVGFTLSFAPQQEEQNNEHSE